jgi:hypothetical protein
MQATRRSSGWLRLDAGPAAAARRRGSKKTTLLAVVLERQGRKRCCCVKLGMEKRLPGVGVSGMHVWSTTGTSLAARELARYCAAIACSEREDGAEKVRTKKLEAALGKGRGGHVHELERSNRMQENETLVGRVVESKSKRERRRGGKTEKGARVAGCRAREFYTGAGEDRRTSRPSDRVRGGFR